MKKSLKYRSVLADARRVIVKIGSRVLVQKTGRPDIRRIKGLVIELAKLQRAGYEIVVVTSGAIGAGMEALKMKDRPTTLPDLQMAAAVGQCRLMSRYDSLFAAAGCKIGQVLLTHDDFHHKIRLTNAHRTMERMIRNKVIPIVNENDVVADEEIKADLALGDNDLLAALLTKLIRADLLIMLTTVDGVREMRHGKSHRIRYIESITRNTYALVTGDKSRLSKGGMASKLRAVESVSKAGSSALIADGRDNCILTRIMSGADVGTLVLPSAI